MNKPNKIGWLILFLLFSFGNTLNAQERFRIVRDQNGHAEKILDSSLGKKNNLLSFVASVREDLSRLTQSSDLQNKALLNELFGNESVNELEEKIKKYQRKISKHNVDSFFDDNRMTKVLSKFESELELIRTERYQTVAHITDKYFFSKEELFVRAIRATKTLAKSLIDGGVFLNLVFYIVDQYVGNMVESKSYHQHILLSWLNSKQSNRFKLTEMELKKAKSSIMESRLDIWNVFSLLSVKSDFPGFYDKAIKKVRKKVRKRMRKNACHYEGRVDFVDDFHGWWVDKKTGNRQILNLFQKRSYFSNKPSVAFDQERPELIRKKRKLFKLINFAQNLIPVPFIGSLIKTYNDKRFEKQTREEGLLYGYYEIIDDAYMMEILSRQAVNPLLRL
ncbi:MAG: hypothetical protein KC493_11145 [Bacteriovoracaceae bacterium]|nr:hypothetical protein [Bacteriovoracaceae bacterium]